MKRETNDFSNIIDKKKELLALSRMKELLAFYQRMSQACINEEIAHNYRIRADVISIVIEQMIQAEKDSAISVGD